MLLKCSFSLKHNKTNQISSTRQFTVKIFTKSEKTPYLVEIKLLMKRTMKVGKLQLVSLIESLPNLANDSKMMSLVQTRIKSKVD